jgi:hypothetical protein
VLGRRFPNLGWLDSQRVSPCFLGPLVPYAGFSTLFPRFHGGLVHLEVASMALYDLRRTILVPIANTATQRQRRSWWVRFGRWSFTLG